MDAAAALEGAPAGVRGNPVGLNRYAHAGNDPINGADRNGHFFGFDDAIAAGIGAAFGALGQAASDFHHGEMSDGWSYARSAIAGAAAGEVGYYGSLAGTPIAGGALAGATCFLVDDMLQGYSPDLGKLATSTAIGAITGGVMKGAGRTAVTAEKPARKRWQIRRRYRPRQICLKHPELLIEED